MQEKSLDLEKLANDVFGHLATAEQGLLRQSQRLIRQSSKRAAVTADAESHDVSRSHTIARKATVDAPWGKERTIQSKLLRWLCADRTARQYLDDFWIELEESRVEGRLDLSHLNILFPIICRSCRFPDGIDLNGATVSHLDLEGSRIGPEKAAGETTPVFSAEGLSAKGSVLLRRLRAEGEVNFIGADIRGDLSCSGAEFNNAAGTALVLDRAKIHRNLNLREKFAAKGQTRMIGAAIQGDLDCRGSTFEYIKGSALAAQGATINGSMFLCNHENVVFEARGPVRLDGAHVHGDLNCRYGVFKEGFALPGIEIGGQFICTGSRFLKSEGNALNAERAKIHGAVFLGFSFDDIVKNPKLKKANSGFLAEGEVRFYGASIGNLICHAGQFRNPGSIALNTAHTKITGDMLLRFGFDVEGEVRLFGAEVGGDLECSEANFRNPGANLRNPDKDLAALRLDRTTIGGAVDLSPKFHTDGNVLIHSATINKDLKLTGAHLKDHGNKLIINNSEIKGVLEFKDVKLSPNTVVDLQDTSCGVLNDDLRSWPLRSKLVLDGLVYSRLRHPDAVMTRIDDWLRRQLPADKTATSTQFWPQPYRQLAAVLRAQGLDRDAKTVLIEMARDRRKWAKEGSRLRQWLLWVTIRNGYQPIRAGLLLIGLWIFGYAAFGIGYNVHVMVPTDRFAIPDFVDKGTVPVNYEPFCAATYAIDTSLPIISFGQRDKWHPAAPTQSAASPIPDRHGGPLCDANLVGRWYHQIMGRWFHLTEARQAAIMASSLPWVRWGYIAVGWFLTTMFVAGISGLVGRE